MQTLSATPTEVGKLFGDRYTIPVYQRPYSWDEDRCQQLWDDIETFFLSRGTNEKYFCGSVIFFNDPVDGKTVIDGQQRLTTFMLLLKALLDKAAHKRLENCVFIKDDVTGSLTDELRVNSNVLGNDRKMLSEIIIQDRINEDPRKYNNFEKNYMVFIKAIDAWRKGKTTDDFNNLIKGILDEVVLLPIECSSQDDALTIFDTVNNRGMSLSDADIFKAILYKHISNKETFLTDWDNFRRADKKDNYDWLFNTYMHILMSQDGTIIDTRERVNKRKYFDKKKILQKKPAEAMEALKKIDAIWNTRITDKSYALWNIMRQYPNDLWHYPVYTFLFTHGEIDDETGTYVLESNRVVEFEILMESLAKYCLLKGVVHNTSNAIKHTLYKICKEIANDGNYSLLFDITTDDKAEFERKIRRSDLARFTRCVILLSAFLNPKQDMSTFGDLFNNSWDIEHILPKKGWNNYDGWTKEGYDTSLNLIGNLVPFDRVLNIQASNSFFEKKKDEYAEEDSVQDVIDLLSLSKWEPVELAARNDEKIKLLLAYFGE